MATPPLMTVRVLRISGDGPLSSRCPISAARNRKNKIRPELFSRTSLRLRQVHALVDGPVRTNERLFDSVRCTRSHPNVRRSLRLLRESWVGFVLSGDGLLSSRCLISDDIWPGTSANVFTTTPGRMKSCLNVRALSAEYNC